MLRSRAFATIIRRSFSIKNDKSNVCANCIHFIPWNTDPKVYEYGKCRKFGNRDLVSGLINYNYADICRNNEDYCGKSGKQYEGFPTSQSQSKTNKQK